MSRKMVVLGIVSALLLGLSASAGAELRIPEIAAGKLTVMDQQAPPIAVPEAASGQLIQFPSIAKGKAGVITFMQTSCSSCKQLTDRLQQIAAKRPDIAVIAVAIDIGGAEVVTKYAKYFGFGSITFLADPPMVAAKAYGVTFTPGTFILDKKGTLKAFMAGYDEAVFLEMERTLNDLAR